MRKGKSYRTARVGRSLVALTVVGSSLESGKAESRLRLLLDTGASYTMLSAETLNTLGYDISQPVGRVRLQSANGIIVAPLVKVAWFNCLGQLLKDFTVVAHTIPADVFDGVLGLDFLIHCRAVIAVAEAEVSFR